MYHKLKIMRIIIINNSKFSFKSIQNIMGESEVIVSNTDASQAC